MARLNVNGAVREFDAEPDTPLLWVLREQLGLTGTKYGCGIAACGACTVHIDGVPTRSCVRPVSSVGPNEKVVTIEALAKVVMLDGELPRPERPGAAPDEAPAAALVVDHGGRTTALGPLDRFTRTLAAA